MIHADGPGGTGLITVVIGRLHSLTPSGGVLSIMAMYNSNPLG
jgi:hypothetical protein